MSYLTTEQTKSNILYYPNLIIKCFLSSSRIVNLIKWCYDYPRDKTEKLFGSTYRMAKVVNLSKEIG